MSKFSKICLICLRADRKLRVVDSKLSDFRDELCDYSITVIDPRYCYECEYLLRKMYNFKTKCVLATKIIKMERKKKVEKTPTYLLYTLIPSNSLGFWTSTNTRTRVYSFEYEEDPMSDTTFTTSLSFDNIAAPSSDITVESLNKTANCSNTGAKISNATAKSSNTSAITTNTAAISSNTAAISSNTAATSTVTTAPNSDAQMSNVCASKLLTSDGNKQSKKMTDPHIVIVPMDTIFSNVQNSCSNQVKVEHPILNVNDIKQETDLKNTVELQNMDMEDAIKVEENVTLVVVDEIDDGRANECTGEDSDVISNMSDKCSINSDLGELIDNMSDDSCTDNDCEEKDVISSKTNGVTEDCHGNTNDKATLGHNKDTKPNSMNKVVKNRNTKVKKIIKKEEKKRCVNKIKDSKIKERFHTNRGILAELANLADSDRGELSIVKMKRSLFPYNKERLITEVTEKFASCGELKSDGVTIDKEFVIECLKDKVTEIVMRQLWNAVHARYTIKPKALKLFRSIQNKYKNDYDSVFVIEYLNTKQKMVEEFANRKNYECYANAEFKCEVCFTGFKHEKRLENHKKCHDQSAGSFICPICCVRQKNKRSLINHLSSHEAVYKCKLCPLVTYYRSSMVNHYQQHNGVKYKCEQCHRMFGSRSAYVTHLSYRHARRHVCTACARAFSSPIGLKWHITHLHQNDPPGNGDGEGSVSCEQCALRFPSTEVFLRHLRTSHELRETRGRKPGTTFTYNRLNMKPRKKPVHTCRVCDATGHSLGWLNLHLAMEHPDVQQSVLYVDKKSHLCHVCGKGFSTIYILNDHLSTHSGLKPHACPACPAKFSRQLSLRLHSELHAPPTRACPHCGKKFRSCSNLANHIRFHVGDRRYKCKICNKGFLHRNTLNEHVRGVHFNVRRVRRQGARGDKGAPPPGHNEGE